MRYRKNGRSSLSHNTRQKKRWHRVSKITHYCSKRNSQKLTKQKKLKKNRKLIFEKNDLLDANIEDASAIYIASLCFLDKLMDKITQKLAKLKKGLKVASLRPLTDKKHFTLLETAPIPMTWSKATRVYFYELTD